MEVIEHVADKRAFLQALIGAMADDGLMILSTPNRTPQSKWLMIEAAERIGMVRAARTIGRISSPPNWR
jgi:2-polyprenyl-6-hydroxyphenyl methylase/3-demethylubiquinone-9 3-methyltransferase